MSNAQSSPIQQPDNPTSGEITAPTRHEVSKVRAAKVGHKKSRRGCMKCKSRRVKCDEVNPECGNCRRLGLDCSYKPEAGVQKPASTKPSDCSDTTGVPSLATSSSVDRPNDGLSKGILPETRERRLLELRLQQHWLLKVCPLLVHTVPPNMREQWQNLHHTALLYHGSLNAVMSLAATHMLVTLGPDPALTDSRNQYLALALGELQSRAEQLTPNNATGIALTALLMFYNALYMLAEPRESFEGPYKARTDFLQMGRIAAGVLYVATQVRARNVHLGQNRIEMILSAEGPLDRTWREMRKVDDIRGIFEPVLFGPSALGDTWADSNKRVYETALANISAIYAATTGDQTVFMQAEDLQAFTRNTPEEFLKFVDDGVPRAVVMMAYFLAVLSTSKVLRQIDKGGAIRKVLSEEIRAAEGSLGSEWATLMMWPVMESGRSQGSGIH